MELARVLVIDDDLLVARSAQRSLVPHDVQIETNPVRAVSRLFDGEQFDLILCDFVMPRFNGGDVLRAVAEMRPDLLPAFVFVTGEAASMANATTLASAPGGVIFKPWDPDDFKRLAAKAVARRLERVVQCVP
jgi:CheY-like chemotaxis protein